MYLTAQLNNEKLPDTPRQRWPAFEPFNLQIYIQKRLILLNQVWTNEPARMKSNCNSVYTQHIGIFTPPKCNLDGTMDVTH